MEVELIETLSTGTFEEKASSKVKYFNPPNIIFQHVPVEETVKLNATTHHVFRLGDGYITDVLANIGVQEPSEIDRKIVAIH